MLADLGDHFTGRLSDTNIDSLLKTGKENVEKTRLDPPSVLPNPAQSTATPQITKDPLLPSEIEGLEVVTRVGIEPTTNGLKELLVTTRIFATMQ